MHFRRIDGNNRKDCIRGFAGVSERNFVLEKRDSAGDLSSLSENPFKKGVRK